MTWKSANIIHWLECNHCGWVKNKHLRIPKGYSNIENTEELVTQGTQYEEKKVQKNVGNHNMQHK